MRLTSGKGRVCQCHSLHWISCWVGSLDSWQELGQVSNPSLHYHIMRLTSGKGRVTILSAGYHVELAVLIPDSNQDDSVTHPSATICHITRITGGKSRVHQHHSLRWISCQVGSLDSRQESGQLSNPPLRYHLPHCETYQWQRQGSPAPFSPLDIMLSWQFRFLTRIRMSQ